jgi:MFS family permease
MEKNMMLNWINGRKNNMQQGAISFTRDVKARDPRAVYYLVTFLHDFSISLHAAIYVLFLLSHNLSLLEVSLVNLSFMLGNFFFEIPTGAYADFFGRRKSLILSSLFLTGALAIYFISTNILMFIIAELIAALAFTFASGALDAWMVDSLEGKGYIGKVDFVFSQASIVSYSASLVGGLIGGYLGNINLALPFGVGALVSLSSLAAVVFLMHEKPVKTKALSFTNGFKQMAIVAKDSINYGVRHKVVLWLILSSMLAFFAFQPLNMYWAPRINALSGNQVWLMGWIWVGVTTCMMLGSYWIRTLLKKQKSYLWILIAMSLFLSLPILLASISNIFALVVSGYILHEIGRGMIRPMQKSYLNKHIPSEKRATILSFDSMMGKLGAAGGLVVLGFVANNYSIQDAWLISGVLLLFLIPIYIKVTENEKALP